MHDCQDSELIVALFDIVLLKLVFLQFFLRLEHLDVRVSDAKSTIVVNKICSGLILLFD